MYKLGRTRAALLVVPLCAAALACAQAPDAGSEARPRAGAKLEQPTREPPSLEAELSRELERIAARADSVDAIFRPLPLLRPADETALRRYPNRAHVARAQRLGIPRSAGATARDELLESGRLIELEDSTAYWVVRELNRSVALVVPDTRALLVEIGERFQARLAELGAPPFRFEISSVLRTAEDQAALRRRNANAASGVSAHEYGTTVDIAYNGFAAPASTDASTAALAGASTRISKGALADASTGTAASDGAAGAPLAVHLAAIETAMLERVAGRRSGELKAILGGVLRELQTEGKVLVTLERQQPVYHLTVGRRLE